MTEVVPGSAPPPTDGAGGSPEPAAASPAAAPAAIAAPAPEANAPAPDASAAAPAEAAEPTLLDKFDAEQAEKKAKEKPAEPDPSSKAKPVEAKPEQAKPEGAPAEPAPAEPIAYEYTLPETIKMDDALKGSFHTALDAFRTDPAKGAQGLVDLHNQAMQSYAEQVYRDQVRIFNDTRKGWQTKVMSDEELGGAGYQTTMGAIARMRDMLVPEKHRAEFDSFLKVTGAGDHPEFLRLLHNAARIYDEAPMPPPGAKPPANLGKPQGRGLRSIYKPRAQ